MFYELINALTPEQMSQLKALGVPHTRVSEWRHKKGLPSRKAVTALATVTGVDPMEIEREVMYLELKPDERAFFQKLLKVPASALMGVLLILQQASQPENANAANNLAHKNQGGENIHCGKFRSRLRTKIKALLKRGSRSKTASR